MILAFSLSPLLDRMVSGELHHLEEESGVVPFQIGKDKFSLLFILVDGIHPPCSRFVKGIKEPISLLEKKYTSWQEGCRKDIGRAFGVLKGTWQRLVRPIHLQGLQEISEMVGCCLLLHNMLVTDRVMTSDTYNFRQRHDPANRIEKHDIFDLPTDIATFVKCNEGEPSRMNGVANAPLLAQR
jgi:hypothetical protein